MLEIESQGEIWVLLMIGLRGNVGFANRGSPYPVQCPSWHASGALYRRMQHEKNHSERIKRIMILLQVACSHVMVYGTLQKY